VSVLLKSNKFKITALDCAVAAPANNTAILAECMVLERKWKLVIKEGRMHEGKWLKKRMRTAGFLYGPDNKHCVNRLAEACS
jgi:hypothetical protein